MYALCKKKHTRTENLFDSLNSDFDENTEKKIKNLLSYWTEKKNLTENTVAQLEIH